MHDAGPSKRVAKALTSILVALVLVALGASTAVAQETTTTVAPADTSTTTLAPADTAAPTSAVAPRPADYQPLNPGLAATDMSFQVWPEYDTGEVLVLIDLTLPADTTFPYTFTFYAPNGARLTGIAEVDSAGQFVYKMAPPKITPGTNWEQVTITVPSIPRLRLEYYYNPGVAPSGQKSFDVSFRAPADVGALGVGVQQPLRSTEFSVQPALARTSTDSEGFNYALDTLTGIEEGDLITLRVTYTKGDNEPSVQGSSTSSTPGNSSQNYLLYLLVVLAVAVLGMVAYRVFARPRAASAGGRERGGRGAGRPAAGRPAGSSRSGAEAGAGGRGGPTRFCTQCGAKLSKKDRFCPQCGHERES
ncbi:MAG: zinc ribbon domain-containing protein [Thermoleophilia bacterium]|nr:zinc ribbon domain-containing protein [Thermoleophilia bacterium]